MLYIVPLLSQLHRASAKRVPRPDEYRCDLPVPITDGVRLGMFGMTI
jgi:hypothetical protein